MATNGARTLQARGHAAAPLPARGGLLRRRAAGPGGPALAPPVVHQALRGTGRPLDPATRQVLEPRFGHDFGRVRVHTDARAAESAEAVGAVAYTVGNRIVFGRGAYRPDTPAGLRLVAHELSHVVQQDGAADAPAPDLAVGPADDPWEREADRAADVVSAGGTLAGRPARAGRGARLQRAVSKVCNPPSVWFVLGGPQNLPAAQAFGAIAEAFISADVISRLGVTPGNFYFDNPLAGPIDPLLVAFIIAKNPGLPLTTKLALAAAAVARPDVLMHQGSLTEFEEVKPNSVAGRAAGRAKVGVLSTFYSGLGLPYTAGSTYTPPPPFVIASGSIGSVPITITFEVTRDRNGLLVYDICVETDWLIVAVAAIAIVILIILALILGGILEPVPLPVPAPAPIPVPVPALGSTGAPDGALADAGAAAGDEGSPSAEQQAPPSPEEQA